MNFTVPVRSMMSTSWSAPRPEGQAVGQVEAAYRWGGDPVKRPSASWSQSRHPGPAPCRGRRPRCPRDRLLGYQLLGFRRALGTGWRLGCGPWPRPRRSRPPSWCQGPLAAELLLQEPWVGDCTRIPGMPWKGPERAREDLAVAALGPESESGAHLAAQPEVGNQLRPGQGQEVQVSARLLAPRAFKPMPRQTGANNARTAVSENGRHRGRGSAPVHDARSRG